MNDKFLINIPKTERENNRTPDSIKYKKDCGDFVCLEDGTITRECRYCNLSTACRHIDVLPNGKVVPMEDHWLPVEATMADGSKELYHELFCTGMYDNRPYKERLEDDKVS
jgi:hypothetical protein